MLTQEGGTLDKLKGAEIVLQLRARRGSGPGVRLSGRRDHAPCMMRSKGSGIRHVLTRHEQGAVFSAEGYARVTGKVGVAIATSGPGATNLVTGIADAKMDSVPLGLHHGTSAQRNDVAQTHFRRPIFSVYAFAD